MSRTLTLRSLDIPSIHKFGIGFDGMLNELMRMTEHQSQTNYPPYNVVKITENEFVIEVAVAGFSKGEVTLELNDRILAITGIKNETSATREYLHKGISDRGFIREFTLAEHVEVMKAENNNGILAIYLKRMLPEKNAPKIIDINHL